LAAGFRPDPLGELTALPRHPSWIKGSLPIRKGDGKGRGERWKGGSGGKGEKVEEAEVRVMRAPFYGSYRYAPAVA